MRAGIFSHRVAHCLLALLEKSLIGRVLTQAYFDRREKQGAICFVAATRLSEVEFWKKSLLGKRLKSWRNISGVKIRITFDNHQGLPKVYNEAIAEADVSDVLVFIHDDAWLLHEEALTDIWRALRRFDIVGIAGNTRRAPRQYAWYLRQLAEGGPVLDLPHLSGAVHYGEVFKTELHQFGPWPAECELLDGVLMAARVAVLRRTGLRFDERFDFHFYDLDFSRTARQYGLKIGTWPIHLLHASKGNLEDPRWRSNLERYTVKWGD